MGHPYLVGLWWIFIEYYAVNIDSVNSKDVVKKEFLQWFEWRWILWYMLWTAFLYERNDYQCAIIEGGNKMKKYINPKLVIKLVDSVDIIMTSISDMEDVEDDIDW